MSSEKPIAVAIFGAGGLGRMVLDILRQMRGVRVTAFLESDPAATGRCVDQVPVLGGIPMLGELRRAGTTHVIVAIGDNWTRVGIAEQVRGAGLSLGSAIHPQASVSPSARIGEHAIVGPRTAICVKAQIGEHSVISAGAIVDHDGKIGHGVFLHPAVRLAGGVSVDDFATLEVGATVIPGRRVGRAARVAAGAVVIRDVPPGSDVSGVPAAEAVPRRGRFVAEIITNEPAAQTVRAAKGTETHA